MSDGRLLQQGEVAKIGLEADVENIAHQWHETDRPVGGKVGGHSCLYPAAELVLPREHQGVDADQSAHRIADDGDQAKNGIHAKADAPDGKLRIKKLGQMAGGREIRCKADRLGRLRITASHIHVQYLGHRE